MVVVHHRRLFRPAFVGAAMVLTVAGPGAAQDTRRPADGVRRWEIDVHAGGIAGANATDGTGSLPPAGTPFTTMTGRLSRRASSWYFGDGAALLNEINAALGVASSRVIPLDGVITRSATTRRKAGGFGARVGYRLTPQLTAEFEIDRTTATLGLSDGLLAGVEASRASFRTAWNGLVSSGGGVVFSNASVLSTTSVEEGHARQVFATGALRIDLATRGRVLPYVTVGGGLTATTGDLPAITLAGNYRFMSLNAFPPPIVFAVNESDTVTIRFATRNAFVTLVGGGVTLAGSSRWGVRADARVWISRNTIDVLIDATPAVASMSPSGLIASGTTPSMQFANTGGPARSTLGGPAIEGFRSFTGAGVQVQVGLSLGYVLRF